ncbi:hypothetical protein ACVWW4_007848 [Bradyrhizobium sp. LB7.1]
MVSKTSCLSCALMSMNDVARSASAPGAVVLWNIATSSGGACGSSSMASMARRCRFSARASISGEFAVGSGICWIRAAGNGVPGRKSRMRARCTPWQTM